MLWFQGCIVHHGLPAIEKKITEIQLDAQSQFDIATNIEFGKFFPQKTGIKIPMHFDYSETRIKPKYNPLDPDLELDEVLDSYELQDQQDSLKALTIDFTQRKNINFHECKERQSWRSNQIQSL